MGFKINFVCRPLSCDLVMFPIVLRFCNDEKIDGAKRLKVMELRFTLSLSILNNMELSPLVTCDKYFSCDIVMFLIVLRYGDAEHIDCSS